MKAYLLKIRGGVEVDSQGKKAGKGPLIQEEVSATLGVSQDQTLFQPVVYDRYNQECSSVAPTLKAVQGGDSVNAVVQPVAYAVENHPQDSRVKIKDDGIVQTLDARMGMGGGNVPMVLEPVIDVEMEVAVRKYPVDETKLVNLLREHKSGKSNKDIADALDVPETMVAHWFRKDKYFAVPDADYWHPLKALLGIETDEFDKVITEYEFRGSEYDMRNRIYTGDVSPTLLAGSGDSLYFLPVEHHPQDSRAKISFDGINQPLTSNMEHDPGNGGLVICYGICGYESNSMKSDNPHSGIYEAKTSRTLDLNGGNPACNQGGIAIVYPKTTGSLMASGYQKNGTQEAMNDMYVVLPMFWDGGQVASTLTANNAGGAQRMPDKDNFNCILEPIAIDRAAFNQGENALYDFQISGGGTAQTIIAKGPGAVCYKKPSEACKQETSRESETNM